ncbi:unnamed protein product, partial [Ixodes persulcatus]
SVAAASIDDHARQHAVDDVVVIVEVEHRNGRDLARGAAGASGAGQVHLLYEVRVRVLLHEHVWALAAAVVGLVALGRDDPVPAELLEVHRQRVAAAALLARVLLAVEAYHAPRPAPPAGLHHDHEKRP